MRKHVFNFDNNTNNINDDITTKDLSKDLRFYSVENLNQSDELLLKAKPITYKHLPSELNGLKEVKLPNNNIVYCFDPKLCLDA